MEEASLIISIISILVGSYGVYLTLIVKANTETLDEYIRNEALRSKFREEKREIIKQLTDAKDTLLFNDYSDRILYNKILQLITHINRYDHVLKKEEIESKKIINQELDKLEVDSGRVARHLTILLTSINEDFETYKEEVKK